MKNLYLFWVFILLSPLSLFPQGENDNWYFGNKAAVNFASGSPLPVSGSEMDTREGVASISDSTGGLLFYTDGRRVWNKNHQIMPNGYDLTSSGRDAHQGVVIIPFPGHPDEYLIFTTNGGVVLTGTDYDFMAYSRVDMTQENGLGDIVELNTPLEDHNGNITWEGKVEAITVVNNNNLNYWVVLPHQNRLLSYYVNANGVNTTPVQSQINSVFPTASQIKVSPNNQMLAIVEYIHSRVSLYYFNSSIGQVVSSTPFVIISGPPTGEPRIYSTEFSHSNNNLWISLYGNMRRIYGYDLNDLQQPPTILNFLLPHLGHFGTIQRGVDNEIYVAKEWYGYLGKINNSNDLNSATLSSEEVYLNGNSSNIGLPQLVPIMDSSGGGDPTPCPEDVTLSTSETNTFFLYEASNSITTNQNYEVGINQNITLSAGNYIEMHPNTSLKAGSVVLAKIEDCAPSFKNNRNMNFETTKIYIDLDGDEKGKGLLTVYPNPAKKYVNVSLADHTINKIKLISLDGKVLIDKTNINNDARFYLNGLRNGVYILSVETNEGLIFTEKLVKM